MDPNMSSSKRKRTFSSDSSHSDDSIELNVSSSTDEFQASGNEDLHKRLQEHLDIPSSPVRILETDDSEESLQGRVDLHCNVVDPDSQSRSAAIAEPTIDTPLKTDDGLEEVIAKHFQVLSSSSKLNCSFATTDASPSPSDNSSVNAAADSSLKMHVSRAINFKGLLDDLSMNSVCSAGSISSMGRDDDTSDQHIPTDCPLPLGEKEMLQSDTDSASISDSSDGAECESEVDWPIDIALFDDHHNSECEAAVNYFAIEPHNFENEIPADLELQRQKNNLMKALGFNNLKLHNYTTKTVNEGILSVMELYLNNHDSKAGLQRLLSTTCSLLPHDHRLPTSSHQILQYIRGLSPPIPAITHFYCQDCLFYNGQQDTGRCSVCTADVEGDHFNIVSKFNHFFTFDIGATLKYLFECRNLADVIDAASVNRTDVPGSYSDILDGSVYRQLNVNRNRYDINLVMNSDGVRIRESSNKELWVVMFSIAEVPMALRQGYIIFTAVWYDKPKPKMNTFLRPSCEELETLHKNGLEWQHPTSRQQFRSKVQVPLGIFDAPARAMVQNTLMYNGTNGCNTCEIETVRSAPIPNKKRIRIYPYFANPVLRTKETMAAQASEALQRNVQHVVGVKGPSVLSMVPSVDISNFFIPEYMHAVLLGVTKQMLTIWTSVTGPWNVRYCLPEIDEYLAAIKHPDFVHKAPRVLMKMKFMKASDFYYFLLFEGLPALQERLPERFFQHFILLVKGIYLLLQSTVKENDIQEADHLLQLFLQSFENLYSDRQLTSNIHSLCHLALVVKRHGPLSCNNAFIYEDMNGLIGKSTHGTKNVATEIVNNIRIAQGVSVLKNIVKGHLRMDRNTLLDVEVLGKSQVTCISLQEAEVLGADALIFSRAKIGSEVFTSEIYKKLNTENFHVMVDGNKYAVIKYFAKTGDKVFVCLRWYSVNQLKVLYHLQTHTSISHLIPVKNTNEIVVKDLSEISVVKVGKIGCYLFKRPNLLHGAIN